MENNTRALKRKRVDSSALLGPDGFAVSKPSSRLSKTVVSSFSSAFEKIPKKIDARKASNGLIDSEFSIPLAGAAPKPVTRPKFTLDSQLVSSEINDSHSTPRKPTSRTSAASGKKLVSALNIRPIASPAVSESAFSRLKIPILPPRETKPSTKPLLKSLAPPRLPPPKPAVAQKVFLPQHSSKISAKPLRTIATTRVARATDLSTENGTAEIASIFLQDPSEFNTLDVAELKSGLELSPKKGYTSGRGSKFVRNGLAAHAASLLSHANTSLALWAKESSALPKLPKADLRLRVVKIIHRPVSDSHAPSMTGLALCRVHTKEPLFDPAPRIGGITEFPVRLDETDPNLPMVLVLFSFTSHPSPPSNPIRNSKYFEEGAEFWIWKPWRALPLGTLQTHSLTSMLVPGSAVEKTALLCDRFGRHGLA